MSISAKLEIAGQEYAVTFQKGEVSVSGGDEFLSTVVGRLFEQAAEEYSPSMGSKGAYVAKWVADLTKGKVLSVEEPESAEGEVY